MIWLPLGRVSLQTPFSTGGQVGEEISHLEWMQTTSGVAAALYPRSHYSRSPNHSSLIPLVMGLKSHLRKIPLASKKVCCQLQKMPGDREQAAFEKAAARDCRMNQKLLTLLNQRLVDIRMMSCTSLNGGAPRMCWFLNTCTRDVGCTICPSCIGKQHPLPFLQERQGED